MTAVLAGFFNSKTGWKLFGIFLFLVLSLVLIIPHELGHAFTARLLGMHVFRILIGSGKIIAKFEFLGFLWEFKQFPFFGLTLHFAKSAKLYRLNCKALALLELGKFEEAKAIFIEALEKQDQKVKLKALISNNLAYIYISMENRELLAEAETLSSFAYENIPWDTAIKGTRGMVLVDLGRLAEGIRLLKDSFLNGDTAKHRAVNAAYLANAKFRKGNTQSAQQYLDVATNLDSGCWLLKRAKAEILNKPY